jgi:hypothetical protein
MTGFFLSLRLLGICCGKCSGKREKQNVHFTAYAAQKTNKNKSDVGNV